MTAAEKNTTVTADNPATPEPINVDSSENVVIHADDGSTVTLDMSEHAFMEAVDRDVTNRVAEAIIDADKKRQELEDQRADRRNRNRSYTLLVALVMTFFVPFVLANVLHAPQVLKYATGIAIIPDALITLWAYIRKY